ncbi:hypothetical protein SCLCIDRAFT_1225219 [Scleroderma citrinum Foug A]|uniref:Uncharacterized protein n=1 Tax=Scleroderma citrinum Foug A TaxID=1036808 RepID=A0A0C3D3I3_9AGAM|nr:hypothetical protein SCLCIDRAFT_1225219 [Scleroderma citrinum Foug A]
MGPNALLSVCGVSVGAYTAFPADPKARHVHDTVHCTCKVYMNTLIVRDREATESLEGVESHLGSFAPHTSIMALNAVLLLGQTVMGTSHSTVSTLTSARHSPRHHHGIHAPRCQEKTIRNCVHSVVRSSGSLSRSIG